MSRTGQPRQKVAKWIREMLPKKCINCGSTKGLQYHHIVPVICGGNDIPSNVAVLCGNCHSRVHYGKDGIINHGDAVKRGQEKARIERGVKPGRKPANGEKIMKAIAENSTQFNKYSVMTENEIMDVLGIKTVCYYKYKRQLIKCMEADKWPYEWEKPKTNYGHPVYEHKLKKIRGDMS